MSVIHSNESQINSVIETIDIEGKYSHLAVPVVLTGKLNIAKLRDEYPSSLCHQAQMRPLQIGVDEAGRGPLLGSVNVAAALLPSTWSGLIEQQPLQQTPLAILTDSKQLSEKKRDILYPLVQRYALGYVIATIPAAVIDQINILQATLLGMRLCTEALLIALSSQEFFDNNDCQLEELAVQVLYDGNRCPKLDYPKLAAVGIIESKLDCQAWVKGDARHTSIAAASILAKVSRDMAMYALDKQHPQYGIAKHKGYPTRAHMQAIEAYGVLDEHRRSFGPIKKALNT